jgi:hypothetical protein
LSAARNRYAEEIASHLRFLAAWLPNRTIRLGSYGAFDGIAVEQDGDIQDLDFALDQDQDASTTELQFQSSGAVEIEPAVGAAAPAIGAEVSVSVRFGRAGATLLHLHQAREHRIAKLGDLKEQILDMSRKGNWPDRRAVVVSVVHAARSTALVASEKGAGVTFSANAGPVLANLADPALDLRLDVQSSMACAITSEGSLTPLYQALTLRRGVLSTNLRNALRSRETLEPGDPLSEAIDDDFALLQAVPDSVQPG